MAIRWHQWCVAAFLGAAAAGGTAAAQNTEVRSPYQKAAAPADSAPAPEERPPPPPRVVADPPAAEVPATAPLPCNPPPTFLQRCQRHLQSCFIGFAAEFEAPPLGKFVYEHGRTEVANGEAARMVLHHYDFVEGSNRLNARGLDELARIAHLMPRNFYPLVVERTPEAPGLAEARRLAVLNELARGNFPVPPQRVVIGPSLANDLRGGEAEIIHRNQLIQTRTAGVPIPPVLAAGTSGGAAAPSPQAGAGAGAGQPGPQQ